METILPHILSSKIHTFHYSNLNPHMILFVMIAITMDLNTALKDETEGVNIKSIEASKTIEMKE